MGLAHSKATWAEMIADKSWPVFKPGLIPTRPSTYNPTAATAPASNWA